MYYIFCNSDFENAVKEIPLPSAKKKYFVNNPNCSVDYYEIWELSDSDFMTIDNYSDDSGSKYFWKADWGWWRWCNGASATVEMSPTYEFTVNGNKVNLFYNESAIKDYANSILEPEEDYDEYWPVDNIDEIPEDIKENYFIENGNYSDIFNYCLSIWGVSSEKNRVALIVANSNLNNIPVYEFLQKVAG